MTEYCRLIYAGPFALQLFPHWLLGNPLSYCACPFYDNCHYDYFLIIQLGPWIKTASCHSGLATASEHSRTRAAVGHLPKFTCQGFYDYLLMLGGVTKELEMPSEGQRDFCGKRLAHRSQAVIDLGRPNQVLGS